MNTNAKVAANNANEPLAILISPVTPSGPKFDCVQVLRRPASYEQAQSLSSDLHTMAMDLQDRELSRLDTVRFKNLGRPRLFSFWQWGNGARRDLWL